MRSTRLSHLPLAALFASALACGSSGGAIEPAADAADAADDVAILDAADAPATDVGAGDASDLGPYPAGPYGTNEGDVLADLQWEGYVDETGDAPAKSKAYVTTSMGAIRSSGRKYALVHLAEFL